MLITPLLKTLRAGDVRLITEPVAKEAGVKRALILDQNGQVLAPEQERGKTDPLLGVWRAAVRDLISELWASLPSPQARHRNGAANDTERQREVVHRLITLLKNDDSEAVDLVDSEAETLRAALGESGFDALAEASHAFDFDA